VNAGTRYVQAVFILSFFSHRLKHLSNEQKKLGHFVHNV